MPNYLQSATIYVVIDEGGHRQQIEFFAPVGVANLKERLEMPFSLADKISMLQRPDFDFTLECESISNIKITRPNSGADILSQLEATERSEEP